MAQSSQGPITRRYNGAVARNAHDLPADSIVVEIAPDEDNSPAAFRALIDELLAGPEPVRETIHAAEELRELRADAE